MDICLLENKLNPPLRNSAFRQDPCEEIIHREQIGGVRPWTRIRQDADSPHRARAQLPAQEQTAFTALLRPYQ